MKNLSIRTIVKFSVFTFALLAINSACQKDDLGKIGTDNESTLSKDGEITVGAKLENPYSLKNMQRAYDSLKSNLGLKSAEVLEPTHYYVRFLPQDTSEYNALKADTTLMLFNYPLDYEISEGDFFHDPTLPEGQITWQYTKVPITYTFGDVRYEIIEELYIPIETAEGELKSSPSIDWYDLLNESMRITGNLDKEIKRQTETGDAILKGLLPSKWNPSATIKAWDDVLNKSIPLKGVKVRARHLLHWESEFSNDTGYVTFDSFRYSVNYSIVWERSPWDIRDGWIIQAYYNGPNDKKSHWTLNITGGKSLSYATIHRAAYRYFYGNNLGLRTPLTTLKIAYLDEKGDDITGDYWSWTTVNSTILNTVLPSIRIYGYDNGGKRTTNEIYATTSHEMAHAAHCDWMGNVRFWQATKYMHESWAVAVGWSLTTQEYADLNVNLPTDFTSNLNRQRWNKNSSNKEYSPLFIDLVDDFNQQFKYGKAYPNDSVVGYTMNSLNKILLNSYGLASLKSELKNNKPSGVTNAKIDSLFVKYNEILE